MLELALVGDGAEGDDRTARPGRARPLRQGRAGRGSGLAQPAAADGDPAVGALGDGVEDRVGGATADEGAHRVAAAPAWARTMWAEVDELAVVLGLLVGPDGLHGRRCSRTMSWRRAKSTPWSAASALFHPKPDAEGDPPAGEMVERGHLLGQHDGVVLGGQQDAGAEADARGHGGRGRQGNDRIQAALVVVEAHAFDEGGRHVLAHRQMGVLGHPERVEAEFLDGRGECRPVQGRGR